VKLMDVVTAASSPTRPKLILGRSKSVTAPTAKSSPGLHFGRSPQSLLPHTVALLDAPIRSHYPPGDPSGPKASQERDYRGTEGGNSGITLSSKPNRTKCRHRLPVQLFQVHQRAEGVDVAHGLVSSWIWEENKRRS
jgi:hypothetical protein